MQQELLYLIICLLVGGIAAWLIAKANTNIASKVIESQYFMLKEDFQKNLDLLEKERQKIIELSGDLAAAEANYQNLEDKLQHQKEEFKQVATEILEERSSQNQIQLDRILQPFHEKLNEFGRKVEDTYKEEVFSTVNYLRLRKIKRLISMNQKDLEVSQSMDEQITLLQTHKHLKDLEIELTKQMGTVILK